MQHPDPLRIRILRALELSPMSAPMLAKALGASVSHVERRLAEMRGLGAVKRGGLVALPRRARSGRQEQLYEVQV